MGASAHFDSDLPPHGLVVCSILERDAARTASRIEQAPAGSALVELRGDHLRSEELAGLVRQAGRPVVVTIRAVAEGGWFDGSAEERLRSLLAALGAGARFVDVEHGGPSSDLALGPQASRVILSHHGAPCRLDVLRPVVREMAGTSAARLKLVPLCTSVGQIGVLRDLLREAPAGRPLAAFASGRAGALSRLLAPSWGSWASYGSSARGAESADGQFTAKEMLGCYDVLGIRSSTRRFALIGSHVFGSPSPAMHHAAYRKAGLDARYFPVEADDLASYEPLLGADGVARVEALAVTLPFKTLARERCGAVDRIARASGAVNTVRVGDAGWEGFNTDGPAVLAAVRRHLDPRGAAVAVIGAGGFARAAASVLVEAGARVVLYNRSAGPGLRSLAQLSTACWDILVQATPLGGGQEQILSPETLRGRLVLDAVYSQRTPLVEAAARRGIPVVDGLELLAGQAALQFERMTGVPADRAVMRQAGQEWLEQRDHA